MSDRTPSSVGLHLGAHKTATTHLQRSIATAEQRLVRAGVRFHGPRSFRWGEPGLFERFGIAVGPRGNSRPAEPGAVARLADGAERLVISEENYPGTQINRWGKLRSPLYPDAARRISALAAHLGPLDLFLSIRQPSTWLNSTFGQLLQADKPVTLELFAIRNPLTGVDWCDLITRLQGAEGVRSLTVWRYEDYNALFGQICVAMLGDVGATVKPLQGRMHPSLSAMAAQALLAEGSERPAAAQAMAQYPLGPDFPALNIFDAETHALSAEDYAAQVARIDAMPGVVRLKPDPA